MRIKKVVATTMAAALAVAAVPSTTVLATAADPIEWGNDGGTQTVTGDGTVTQATIEVALPGEVNFVIDPYMIDSGDKQIVAGDYNVINLGDVDVKVAVKPSLNLGTNVAVQSLGTAITEADASGDATKIANSYPDIAGTNKKVGIIMTFADAQSTVLKDTNGDGVYEFTYTADVKNVGRAIDTYNTTAEKWTYGAAATGTNAQTVYKDAVLAATPATGTAGVAGTFYLESLKSNDALTEDGALDITKAAAAKSVGSFTFGGAVAAHSNLQDGDVQVQVVYELNVQTANDRAKRDSTSANTAGAKSTVKQSMLVDTGNILN